MDSAVKDVMTTNVVAVGETAGYKDIITAMRQGRVSACPVLDGAGCVIGVVSEADLLLKMVGLEPFTGPGRSLRASGRRGERAKAAGVTAAGMVSRVDVLSVFARADGQIRSAHPSASQVQRGGGAGRDLCLWGWRRWRGVMGGGGLAMSFTGVDSLDRSIDKANAWLADIDAGFGTSDRRLAYRVLRAWLRNLRDRLSVEVTAHFAAQLPDLLRGMYFDGWNPSRVPQKYDRAEYVTRFAAEARVRESDVPKAAGIVTAVARRHMSDGVVTQALERLPAGLRELLEPTAAGTHSPASS